MTYTPFFLHGADRPSRWLITCDHATNVVPSEVNGGDLGLPAEDMNRHIAYDPGAYGVAVELGELLDAPVVASNFSRLVIDPNRGADDPTLVMKLNDGSLIPANRHVDAAEVERRLNAYYRPYHQQLARFSARPDTVVVSLHSFTQQFKGRAPRPWHIGVLFAKDERFSRPLIQRLQAEPGLVVGENEPYTGYLPGDAIDTHATASGLLNALIELRNDLIQTSEQQRDWAARLAPILRDALEMTGV
ncbi:MAG: N-formylglutamate amidohydrolase [Paracoccaceae bacterium]